MWCRDIGPDLRGRPTSQGHQAVLIEVLHDPMTWGILKPRPFTSQFSSSAPSVSIWPGGLKRPPRRELPESVFGASASGR